MAKEVEIKLGTQYQDFTEMNMMFKNDAVF